MSEQAAYSICPECGHTGRPVCCIPVEQPVSLVICIGHTPECALGCGANEPHREWSNPLASYCPGANLVPAGSVEQADPEPSVQLLICNHAHECNHINADGKPCECKTPHVAKPNICKHTGDCDGAGSIKTTCVPVEQPAAEPVAEPPESPGLDLTMLHRAVDIATNFTAWSPENFADVMTALVLDAPLLLADYERLRGELAEARRERDLAVTL